MTREERSTAADFAERYRRPGSDATRELELAVIGADFGANGYTTREQADRLGDELRLGPGIRLLDVGAGRGWPGLYLAVTTGCRVVLSDMPVEGLRVAIARAVAEGIPDRVRSVAASARVLPFAPGSVDAITHTDVLC